MKQKYLPFRLDKEGNGVFEPIYWMRQQEVEGQLPPQKTGNNCYYCLKPLACTILPHPTLGNMGIAYCASCDIWMNYHDSIATT